MLKQETFYEVQSWGCVSALLGLPAELIPHAGLSFGVVLLTTCVIIPAQREIVNSFFGIFCKKNSRRGNALPGGKNDREKTYALAFCRSKICGATRIRITTRTVVRMASGSM